MQYGLVKRIMLFSAAALNITIVSNDASYGELKSRTEALERMQKQHGLDIMDLRSAI